MINRIINFFSTMKFATLMLLIFAFSMGYATFIENDFGSSTSKALIYNSWWFEFIILMLVITLIFNIFKRKLINKYKIPTLVFHLSFILIIIGSYITRYHGYEGLMSIPEGSSENKILSDDTFFQLKVNDNINELNYDKKLYLSYITRKWDNTLLIKHLFSNYFSFSSNKLSENFSIEYLDFITNISDSVIDKNISGIILTKSSVNNREGTNVSLDDMITKEIYKSQEIEFDNVKFTLNNPIDNAVNFTIESNKLICNSNLDIYVNTMPPSPDGPVLYQKGIRFQINKMSLLTINDNKYMFSDFTFDEITKSISSSPNMDDSDRNPLRTIDALVLKINTDTESKIIELTGKKGVYPTYSDIKVGNLNFNLSYGPKYYLTPFNIYLDDFILERYSGSSSPSSYSSDVRVIDNDKDFPYKIYMNNVLDYRGYRFFQSSYPQDEKGTILSVNHDWWGTHVSYLGYFFMILGMILTFFNKHTRFNQLTKKLNKLKLKNITTIFLLLFTSNLFSYDNVNYVDSLEVYKVSVDHSKKFENILVQHDGRIKPVSTLSSELIRKISRKEKLYGLNSTQVFLGIMSFPELWKDIPIVKVDNSQLQSELGSSSDLVSFSKFFDTLDGTFILEEKSFQYNSVAEKNKSKYQKELLKVVERVNILYSIISTKRLNTFLKIFPSENEFWNTDLQIPIHNNDTNKINILNSYLQSVQLSTIKNNWILSDTLINIIYDHQINKGGRLIPIKWKIDLEILYNKIDIFSLLFKWYFFTGLIMLICCIISIFYNKSTLLEIIKFIRYLIYIGWGLHTLGLIARWIISNHAPWTNGYEAMIYTVWATMLSGIIFGKNSNFTLATTTCVSSLLLLFAFISYLDPTITNVVPVLNSYWLMIHVSVIVASYGFLITGGFLGLLNLFLIIFKTKSNKDLFDIKISEITIINEKTITVGIYMLSIGTFLGGIWANESWGRYWGWDPKETWALVSILVYAFILHIRFIPKLNTKILFNILTVFAVYSVLMTYFGVNYLLSGLHSYAAGDKVDIPNQVWISLLIVITITTISIYRNQKKTEESSLSKIK